MVSEDFFESIQQHLSNALPFVVYRQPNVLEVKAMLQKNDTLHFIKDYSESGFVFAPFDDTVDAVLIPINDSKTINFTSDNGETGHLESSRKVVSENDSKKQKHINLVQKGIDSIKKNELLKVVLSRCETVNISEENPIEIFKRLLNNYTTAFIYCWYHPRVGLWLGATPETLLKVEGNRFSTMALAGTQVYNGTTDVEWDEKEIEEQQIVVNYLVNSLQPTVSINTSKTETVKAGNLLHLKTQITGIFDFENSKLFQLINRLHPTPAVNGFPKETAKQFILENEHYNREFYTGFLGELNLKQSQTRNTNRRNVENNAYATVKTVSNLYVNLRCMQLKNNEALIYVGGGITKDSVPENEWQETVNKTQTIRKVL